MKKCLSWILAILMLLPLLTVLPTAQADEVVQLRCRVERLEQLLSRAPAQTTAVSGDDTPMGESFEQQYMGLPYVQEACAELGLE